MAGSWLVALSNLRDADERNVRNVEDAAKARSNGRARDSVHNGNRWYLLRTPAFMTADAQASKA
jgi:hypothetical protein